MSSAITKLSEASERVNKEGSSIGRDDKLSSSRGFRRGNNFSDLLQKFSSSEASGSEKSDTDTKSSNLRKPFLTRQEAYTVSSSASSEETRRTPERTQSLRLRSSQSPAIEKEGSAVQRSSSFKSDFMKRRYSPEPEQRRRLPETPVTKKHVEEQTDKPSPELANVLNKRSQIVKEQQETGEIKERDRIHDGKVEKADKFSSAGVDEVIADSEVAKMLKSRRKETDSSVTSVSDKDLKSQKNSHDIDQKTKVETVNAESKTVTKLQDRSRSQTPEKSLTKTEIPKLKSQSSFESKASIHVSSTKPRAEDHLVSQQETKTNGISEVVPKLDLSSIDTSLAVLEHVTHELDEPQVDLKDEKEIKLHKALHDVHVDKQTEVMQFINSVDSDNLNANHTVIQPKVPDTKLNVDSVTVKEERTKIEALENEVKSREDKAFESKSGREQRQRSQEKEFSKERQERELRSESPSAAGTVDITNKNEIKRKFTRDRTPERQSPKRNGPMKVTSTVKVSASAGLTRTESVGRSESERPKGILKRTPSLRKSGVNVDPELASILKNRRAKHEDVEEEEVAEKLTAQEEIKKTR